MTRRCLIGLMLPVMVGCQHAETRPIPPELPAELIELHARRVRCLEAHKGSTSIFPPECETFDQQAAARLEVVITQYGWPTAKRVGEKAREAAFMVIQHAPPSFDPLREKVLPDLQAEVVRGEESGAELALFTDRLLVHQGRPQRYGSQFHRVDGGMAPHPIEDEAHVDERRRQMGLQPFAQYAAGFAHWDDPPDAGQ